MPRPWFSLSARSPCCSTIVRTMPSVAVLTCTTSPPVDAVGATPAVLSPGSGGVMKRDAYRVAPSLEIDRWRTFAPTLTLPVCA